MEFKMYLNELKQELGKDTDVKSDTVVLKFTPDKNKERKLNFSFFFSLWKLKKLI